MTAERLKTYIVSLKGGSGCLFQPMTGNNEYTYILTAKHLFEGIKSDTDGNEFAYSIEDGEIVPITVLDYQDGNWSEIIIKFIFRRGENYFPSNEADAAILKIDFISGFDEIFQANISSNIDDYLLVGFPTIFSGNTVGEKSTEHAIQRLMAAGNHNQRAQLVSPIIAHNQLEGMSGGGIVKIIDEGISIIGIQSKVTHQSFAGGQIAFIPIKYFNKIIESIANQDRLASLYSPYIGSFEFLKDDAFLLSVDDYDEDRISRTRITLKNIAEQIVNSDITPLEIRQLFDKRLLIFDKETSCFSYKQIWIAWLEFLTILNIVKFDPIQKAMLSDIFDKYRLKYIDGYGWTDLRKNISKSDFNGVKPNSTIFISSKTPPKSSYIIKRDKIIDIANPHFEEGFNINKGIDPLTCFDFVHLEHFKEVCIIRKLNEYQNLTEEELLLKLKSEYNEFFN